MKLHYGNATNEIRREMENLLDMHPASALVHLLNEEGREMIDEASALTGGQAKARAMAELSAESISELLIEDCLEEMHRHETSSEFFDALTPDMLDEGKCLEWCNENHYQNEVLEWWATTSTNATVLKAHGEVVVEVGQSSFLWGRQCSGQAIILDSVIWQAFGHWAASRAAQAMLRTEEELPFWIILQEDESTGRHVPVSVCRNTPDNDVHSLLKELCPLPEEGDRLPELCFSEEGVIGFDQEGLPYAVFVDRRMVQRPGLAALDTLRGQKTEVPL